MGEMFIWSKLGQNPLNIHVGTFAWIKNLIWDQLQATKAEIIQSKAIFSCLYKTKGNIQCAKQGIMSGVSHGMR